MVRTIAALALVTAGCFGSLCAAAVSNAAAPASAKKKKTPPKATAKTAARKTGSKTATKTAARTAVKPGTRLSASATRSSAAVGASSFAARRGTARRAVARPDVWKVASFADSTSGDAVDGEDLIVRRAAVDALGPYNGTILVSEPHTGRILTMVNQKLALQSGFQPCSTIKVVAALAALNEGIVERTTLLPVARRQSMDLTDALARSNNPYFSILGTKLGYDKVTRYARQFGLGEKAGWNVEGEHAGIWPETTAKEGVGMMTSFGSAITLTPLQLAALLGAISNGGSLYYLQYPKTAGEIGGFTPKLKRQLEIEQLIPEVKPGLMGAVEYGTARRAAYDPNEPILGKTGTCTDSASPTHLGWFGSFNDTGHNKLVVVVLLTGGKAVNGAVASQVAGAVYKNLSIQSFFTPAQAAAARGLSGGQ